jgi:hypothetical protein
MLRRLFRFLASGNSAATVLATQRAALKAAVRAGDKIRVRELAEHILAANPDEPTAQWNLAVLELQAGSLQRALELFAGLDRVRHGARTQTRVVQDARLAPPDAAAGVFVVGDALVDTTYWSVVDGDKLYWRETAWPDPGEQSVHRRPALARCKRLHLYRATCVHDCRGALRAARQ